MTKKEFEKRILEIVSDHLGDDYNIRIDTVRGRNGVSCRTMIIEKERLKFSSIINIDAIFTCYKAGIPFSEIVEELKESLDYQLTEAIWVKERAKEITDFSKSRSKVIFRLVNYDRNLDMLEKVPHRRLEDLAVVYRVLIGQREGGCITAAVNYRLMKEWNVDEETLYQIACVNTQPLFPMEIHDIDHILQGILETELKMKLAGEDPGIHVHVSVEDDAGIQLYELTNSSENFGAAVVLYPHALETVAERLGSDLVIFPTNVHGVLVVPLTEDVDLESFKDMVESINCDDVDPKDFLSDNVYCYIREEGQFRVMTNDDERKAKR